jgi:tRNA A-37 threonylcarbamoyl transferase component Bud32
VNWQREVSVKEWNGQKVVVKRNKPTKEFHEFLIIYTYSLISILLANPSAPPTFSEIMRNEGRDMRNNLSRMGISTPALISISDDDLVEEYIEGGDLYRALAFGHVASLAFEAGRLTGRLHKAGYAFVDNKAQNYLVRGDSVIRTDLGFIQKSSSQYAKSMDIGSFLASVMDLGRYGEIEKAFYEGYLSESASSFHYLSLLVRNMLSVGFSSDSKVTLKNMLLNSAGLLDI